MKHTCLLSCFITLSALKVLGFSCFLLLGNSVGTALGLSFFTGWLISWKIGWKIFIKNLKLKMLITYSLVFCKLKNIYSEPTFHGIQPFLGPFLFIFKFLTTLVLKSNRLGNFERENVWVDTGFSIATNNHTHRHPRRSVSRLLLKILTHTKWNMHFQVWLSSYNG